MFGAFTSFGKLGALASSVARAWSPAALWPTGTEPGMWIDPSNLASQWQDATGTTPVSTPGTVADSSNPVGLALDLRLGASVLTDPGNHLLQATSTARPLGSARVNAFQYTENLTGAFWGSFTVAPLGVNYITEAAISAGFGFGSPAYRLSGVPNVTVTARVKSGLRAKVAFVVCSSGNVTGSIFIIDIPAKTATIENRGSSVGTFFAEDSDDGYLFVSCSTTNIAAAGVNFQCISVADNLTYYYAYTGVEGAIAVYVTDLDLRPTSASATPYQAILTDGSTYSSTGFPVYQKYDGTDDGMATASFAAGTLTSAMDCLIAVRRDSAAKVIAGLMETVNGARYFGLCEPEIAYGTYSLCGSPTTYVDGSLFSGNAVDLAAALTVGNWHILEYRNLDLSAWTVAVFGKYTGNLFNGARGDILLFPSPADPADRDKAREYLASKYGVTLP